MKKITKVLFFISCIAISKVNAQWNQIGYLAITPDTANNVGTFAGFGSNMYAASNKGLFRSTDNGNNWTNLTYAVPVTQSLSMVSVWEESVSVIYAGSDKRLYKSTNSGSTWTWIPLSIDSMSISEINRSGSNLIFSYNKNFNKGGVFYSPDNGTTWNQATGIPATNPMFDIHVEGDTVYVAGTGGIYKSINKGVNFSFLGNGTNVGLRTITRHATKLIAGDAGGTGMYVSTNGGTTWTLANATVFGGFCQVISVEQAPGIIVTAVTGGTACSGTGNASIKMSVDGGTNWSTFMTNLNSGFYPRLGTNSGHTSFFTLTGNKIYRTNAVTGLKKYESDPAAKLFFDADKNLNIQIPNSTNVDIKIFSVSGTLMYKNTFSESELKISELSNAAPGVYFVMMSSGNKVATQKILKQE
ncbi:MAG: T9SS type A sorting domain-containing protein [Bacteroidetes bacterium]|nr:T9SS type A sorting domain-containing protein [Bacteroidota bacterium]